MRTSLFAKPVVVDVKSEDLSITLSNTVKTNYERTGSSIIWFQALEKVGVVASVTFMISIEKLGNITLSPVQKTKQRLYELLKEKEEMGRTRKMNNEINFNKVCYNDKEGS